jgi:hypothetical protein
VLWCVLTLTFRKNVCSIHTGDILLPFAREGSTFCIVIILAALRLYAPASWERQNGLIMHLVGSPPDFQLGWRRGPALGVKL